MQRRTFICKVGTAGIGLPLVAGLRNVKAFAQVPSSQSPFARLTTPEGDRILVIVRLFGGNDGLNTVVPYADDNYYKARGSGKKIDLSLKPEEVVRLPDNDTMGFHPSLAPLLPLYEEGKLAVVQNVGYPDQDLSHFRSNDIWLSATDASVYDDSGWLGRYLEACYPDYPSILPEEPYAIEFGTNISRALLGHHHTMGFSLTETSYIPDSPAEVGPGQSTTASEEEHYIREGIRQSNIFLRSIVDANDRQSQNNIVYPETDLARDLAAAARLITGGLGTRLYVVNTELYDFHANQLADQKRYLDKLGPALATFQRDIEAAGMDDRVTLITISEFGRRVVLTGGTGTDHGAASMMFVMGSGVRGGCIGNDPNLSDLDGQGNLKMEYDFRQVYSTILQDWFAAGQEETAAVLYRSFDTLPIFRQGLSGVSLVDSGEMVGACSPNPCRDFTVLPLKNINVSGAVVVTNLLGEEVLRQRVEPGQSKVRLNVRNISSGTYFCALHTLGYCSPAQKLHVLR